MQLREERREQRREEERKEEVRRATHKEVQNADTNTSANLVIDAPIVYAAREKAQNPNIDTFNDPNPVVTNAPIIHTVCDLLILSSSA
jgi:hypothetical protein